MFFSSTDRVASSATQKHMPPSDISTRAVRLFFSLYCYHWYIVKFLKNKIVQNKFELIDKIGKQIAQP